jgi:ribosome-binding protein aMBF1 (putative translation factor)
MNQSQTTPNIASDRNGGIDTHVPTKGEDIKKRFGFVIRMWREQSGISQDELGWRAELHRTYISDIERGARNPSLQSIEKLAKALKMSCSKLFQPLDESIEPAGNMPPLGAKKRE